MSILPADERSCIPTFRALLLLITCGSRLGCGGVKFLLASYGVSAISFDLPHSLGVLVSRPEPIIVENLPAVSVNMFGVTGNDPDGPLLGEGGPRNHRQRRN